MDGEGAELILRHPGPVPGSSEPRAMKLERLAASTAAPWTPEQVQGNGARAASAATYY